MEDYNNTQIKFAPFKCPVCNGFGTVSFKKLICHACKGKGFVLINQLTGEIKQYGERKRDKTNPTT